MSQKELFTIVVFSENHVGLFNQLSTIFTRRSLNLESITASPCSIPGVHKMAISCHTNEEMVIKVVGQIEKRIDVIKAFYYKDSDIVYQEVALYKVPTQNIMKEPNFEDVIRRHNARILEIAPEYTIIEKSGHYDETEALFNELKRFDIKQFMRSGRTVVSRSPIESIDAYLAMRNRQKENAQE